MMQSGDYKRYLKMPETLGFYDLPVNLLTIDEEEWFHNSALDPYIPSVSAIALLRG